MGRPVADRPERSRAWGVLAVTLALMALVAVLSSTTTGKVVQTTAASDVHGSGPAPRPARPGHTNVPRARRPANDQRTRSSPAPAGSTSKGSSPPRSPGSATGGSPSGVVSVRSLELAGSALGAATGAGTAGPTSAAADSSNRPSGLSASDVPSVAPTEVSSVDTTTTAPVGAETPATITASHSGTISPTQSVTFSASGGGQVTAAATWSGATTMELSISCPGGVQATHTGASPLSVVVDDTHGTQPCTATLAMLPGERGSADYTVSVEPSA